MAQETIILKEHYTVRDMMQIFNVSKMTVYNWRKRDVDPLPSIVIPGSMRYQDHALRFNPKEVKKWAKRHNKKIVEPFPY